jgi:cold shock CspA family protein
VDKLQGVISAYLPDRGFGFIVTGKGRDIHKYFFHISRVVAGENHIAVGATALFSVLPVQEGKCPSATDMEVLGVQS